VDEPFESGKHGRDYPAPMPRGLFAADVVRTGWSKSAARALTNGLREELRVQHTQLTALDMGFVDTGMARTMDVPRTSAQETAELAFDGVAAGSEEVLAEQRARQVKQGPTAQPPFYPSPGRR
jgi:NAD(P)-dependent dehydrogenase (short-subunit alcohol dehydrogenase family)